MYSVWVGKPEEGKPLGSPSRTWEDNIKIDVREVGWGGVNRIDMAQDRDMWRAVVCGNKPSGSIKCEELLE